MNNNKKNLKLKLEEEFESFFSGPQNNVTEWESNDVKDN